MFTVINFTSDQRSGLGDVPIEAAGVGSRWHTVGSVGLLHVALVWSIDGDPRVWGLSQSIFANTTLHCGSGRGEGD